MALLRINLPPQGLAGVYSRIVHRELGFTAYFLGSANKLGQISGLFARSLAVAVGLAFAAGEPVRAGFAMALRDRLREYENKYRAGRSFPLAEAIDHSVALSDIVARERPITAGGRIEISDNAIADATQADLLRLSRMPDNIDWSQQGPLGSLWST